MYAHSAWMLFSESTHTDIGVHTYNGWRYTCAHKHIHTHFAITLQAGAQRFYFALDAVTSSAIAATPCARFFHSCWQVRAEWVCVLCTSMCVLCVYICMYVCMYVYMYVCACLCVHARAYCYACILVWMSLCLWVLCVCILHNNTMLLLLKQVSVLCCVSTLTGLVGLQVLKMRAPRMITQFWISGRWCKQSRYYISSIVLVPYTNELFMNRTT